MTGTSEGGKKAAATRGREAMSEMGRKGGQHSHQSSSSHRSASSGHDNESTSNRSNKGGQHSTRDTDENNRR